MNFPIRAGQIAFAIAYEGRRGYGTAVESPRSCVSRRRISVASGQPAGRALKG